MNDRTYSDGIFTGMSITAIVAVILHLIFNRAFELECTAAMKDIADHCKAQILDLNKAWLSDWDYLCRP